MELTLLGSVGVLAFVVGGAAVMLIVAFRRTIELRGALLQAMKRIERLEQTLASGAPPRALPEQGAPVAAAPDAVPTNATPSNDAPALAEDRIDPPPLAWVSIAAIIITIAAFTAAQLRWISAQAGVDLAIVAGLATLAAAEWRRRADRVPVKAGLFPDMAGASALIGFALMAGALVYGWGVLHAVSPVAALAGMGVIALAAAALSPRHGPSLLLLALICGAAAPALAPVDTHAPPIRYVLLAALAALTMMLSRRKGARAGAPVWAWLVASIALGWGANGAAWGGDANLVSTIGAYFAALAAFGLAYAWDAGATPLPFPDFWRARWSEPILACALMVFGAAAGVVLLVLAHPLPTASTGPGLVAMAVVVAGAGALRPGLWFAPVLAAIAAAAAIGFWPVEASAVPDAPGLIILGAALALIFSLAGAAAMASAQDPKPGAALAALAPILILAAAHERVGGFGAREVWGLAALAVAAVDALAYLQTTRAKPEAASAFATGAALAVAAALYCVTPSPYSPLALAATLPLIALAARWRAEAGLTAAALALCAVVLVRLIAPQIFIVTTAPAPLLATLFLAASATIMLAAFLFARGSAARQTAFATALVLLAACATLEARIFFTAGRIGAPYASLAEAGLNTLIWLGLAAILAWRFGAKPRPHLFALELIAISAAALHALIICGLVLNPWWGLAPAEAPGWRGLNLVELAFAAPALLFLGYSGMRERQRMMLRAHVASSIGLMLLLLAVVLELRRLFHGAAMAHAPVTMAEAWTYSIAALGFAALLFALAVEHGRRTLRFVAVALAIAALGKMAVSDLSAFEGAPRLAAFFAFAAMIGALLWFSLRKLVPAGLLRGPVQAKTMPDSTLAPPG